MKILIGYDGSGSAEHAIADLTRAGLPSDGTEALVFAVSDILPSLPPQEGGPNTTVVLHDVKRLRALVEDSVARADATAQQAAARVRQSFPAWSVRAQARAGSPHSALVQEATDWRADLLVVGSHGRSVLGRLLLGSVSQELLHHAPCSVRIGRRPANAGRAGESPVRLVLGVDGSADASAAASVIAARRWPAGSEVLVVGGVDSRVVLNYLELRPPDRPPLTPDVRAAATSSLEGEIERVADELRRRGLGVTTSMPVGDAKDVLLQEAERVAADCIIVGAKGHTRLERILLGSVSASLAARATCSVEVVRARPA